MEPVLWLPWEQLPSLTAPGEVVCPRVLEEIGWLVASEKTAYMHGAGGARASGAAAHGVAATIAGQVQRLGSHSCRAHAAFWSEEGGSVQTQHG